MQLRRSDASLATAEGVFARLVLMLPLAVMAGRSAWLYAPDALLFAALALLGYAALRSAIHAGARWPKVLEVSALAMAALTAGCVLAALLPLETLAEAAKLPIAALLLAGLLLDLGRRPVHPEPRYGDTAAAVVAGTMALSLLAHGGLGPALAAIAAGVVALVRGYGMRNRGLFAFGSVVALLGVGFGVEAALAGFSLGTWTTLVLLGATSIVAGSVLERHGTRVGALLARGQRHFQTAR